jgi:uncharacterized protein YlxW (UPF0749 family)
MSVSSLIPLLIFLIPIFGILLAGYKEWLQFKSKQQELGASTQEVEATIQRLRNRLDEVEQEREALIKRVQNLETIVTSEAWDQRSDRDDGALGVSGRADPTELPPSDRDDGPSTTEQADTLAQRLRG